MNYLNKQIYIGMVCFYSMFQFVVQPKNHPKKKAFSFGHSQKVGPYSRKKNEVFPKGIPKKGGLARKNTRCSQKAFPKRGTLFEKKRCVP